MWRIVPPAKAVLNHVFLILVWTMAVSVPVADNMLTCSYGSAPVSGPRDPQCPSGMDKGSLKSSLLPLFSFIPLVSEAGRLSCRTSRDKSGHVVRGYEDADGLGY